MARGLSQNGKQERVRKEICHGSGTFSIGRSEKIASVRLIPFQVMDPISGLVEKLAQGLLKEGDSDSVKEQVVDALGSLGLQAKKKQKAADEL